MSKKVTATGRAPSPKSKAVAAAPPVSPTVKPVAAKAPARKVAVARVPPAPVVTAAPVAPAKAAKAVKAAKPATVVKAAKAVKAVDPTRPAKPAKPPARTPVKAPAKPAAAPTPAEPQPQARASRGAGPVALARSAKKTVPARPAATPVKARPQHALPIFQIYFRPEQVAGLDADFTPFDNSANQDPLHEFAVFERLAQQPELRTAPLWGALSWRFGSKTELSGTALRRTLAEHPGHDLYSCNPFPEHEARYVNGWQQGVPSHPAFIELCTAVFKAAGLDPAELTGVQASSTVSTCNYFVGSPAFWSAYLPWVRGVLDRARAKLPAPVLKMLDSPLSDPKNRHAGSSYWPFIVERLLPVFLRSAGAELKTHKVALPEVEKRLNTHLQRLREMKDVAHRTQSRWLYACWLNYRNLYLLQTAGADWCKRFLPLISTTELEFR